MATKIIPLLFLVVRIRHTKNQLPSFKTLGDIVVYIVAIAT